LSYSDDGTRIAVDGKIFPLQNVPGPFTRAGDANPIYVGAHYQQHQIDTDIFARDYQSSQAGTKFGMMLLYSGEIGINRIIQNYIATRDMYNRNSGEKNQYFIEGEDTFTI